jgi:4-hydroxybenzoate polyprenyltransferase
LKHTGRSALRLVHYWWPLALGWSLTVVVQRSSGRTPDADGLAVLLTGIVAAYSADRVIDPARAAHPWMMRLLVVVGLASAVVCGVAAWRLPIQTSALVPALGLASLGYSRLKQLPITKTVLLPFIWTWAAMALPFNDGSWLGWRVLLQPIAAPLLLLITAGCLLCDLKDERRDRHEGVRSLPAMLGGAATIQVSVMLILAAAVLALIEHRPGIAISAAALGASTLSPALLATDAAGPLLVDVILTLPGILISARVV